MFKRESRFRVCIVAGLSLGLISWSASAGQIPPGIGGLFGAILNEALTNQIRSQWVNRDQSEYECLAQSNITVDQLVADGIGPNDPRVRKIFAQCAREKASAFVPVVTRGASSEHRFVLDGVALGGVIDSDNVTHKGYHCRPSKEFQGFSWCAVSRRLNGKLGPYVEEMAILLSESNVAVFISQDLVPAFFGAGDVDHEIQRLSQYFGESARVITAEPSAGYRHSIIAAWGEVTLSPYDEPTMESLRRGDTITGGGLQVDFLADTERSARLGLSVFRLGGGPGYIWRAQYDDNGKGRLRVEAVNASLLPAQIATVQAPPADTSPAGDAEQAAKNRAAQAEKDRAERLDKATKAATARLDDAGSFVKEHPNSPMLFEYVDRIGALKKALDGGDPNSIEARTTELSDALNRDKDYKQRQIEIAEAQKKEEAQNFSNTIRRAQAERGFLRDYVAKNSLLSSAQTFATLVKELESALQKPDYNELKQLVGRVDLAITGTGLLSEWTAAQGRAAAKEAGQSVAPSGEGSSVEGEQQKLVVTEKNRFLIEGDRGDIEILYNASPSAPNVVQNLRGDFVFAHNDANVCLFGQIPEELALIVREAISAKSEPAQVTIHIEPCRVQSLLNNDIIATERGAFLQAAREDALALIGNIENDAFRRFTEVTAAERARFADAARAERERIKTNIADGAPDGFGVVLLRTGSSNLCLAVRDNMGAHRQLLLRAAKKLIFAMQTEAVFRNTSIEDAFIDAQKKQCGAVYASAQDLKSLVAALERSGIPFDYLNLWLLPHDVAAEADDLAEKAKREAQEAAEREQRNADQARLAATRAKDQSAALGAKQAALRDQYGETAKGASNTLASEIVAWTKDQSGQSGSFYPSFASWLVEQLADHWEITSIDNAVEDFGTSTFKNRPLETVFSRLTFHLKNRMLGEYKDACFVFGRMNDTEFSIRREPVFVQCDDKAAMMAWQAGHQFKSQWYASSSTAVKSDETVANAPSPPDVNPNPKKNTAVAGGSAVSAEALPGRQPLPTIEDLPQYKVPPGIERSPSAGNNVESRYLTIVYGMIKSKLHAAPELHVEMATHHGVVDFYVDEGGNLVGRKLVSSSGSPNLDTAVMEAIAEAAPYPAPPNWSPVSLNYNFGKKAEPIDTSAAPTPIVPSAAATAPAVDPAQLHQNTDAKPSGLF
jgi:TonB family protein